MTKYRVCPLCKGKRLTLLKKATSIPPVSSNQVQVTEKFFGRHGDLVRCKKCGFTYIGDRNYIKKVIGLYRKMSDEVYLQEEKERRLCFARIIANIEKLRRGKKGKILDIGCCTGGLLVEANCRDWEVVGLDPSVWACKTAKRCHNLSILNIPIEAYRPSANSFDAVTILDVLEHVEDPNLIFHKIKNVLRKDGIYCVVTPNYGSFTARLFGKKWWGIRLAHLSYFQEKDINTLIKKNNLRVLKRNTYVRFFSLYYILVRLFPVIERTKVVKAILKRITIPLALFDTFEIYLGSK